MKNSKIHNGLEKSELRDFLSLSIVKNWDATCKNSKERPEISNNESITEWAIKDCENELKYLSKKLELLKEKQAIITIIEMNGWQDFDVSDETEKDLKYSSWLNFIGTEDEYNELLKKVK